MKSPLKNPVFLLSCLALGCTAPILTAQTIIDDNMESYTTATPTSVASDGSGDPANWSTGSFEGGGTVDVTAGVTGVTGSRAAIVTADFSNATDYWGAQLFTEAQSNSGTAFSLSDFAYSISALTSTGDPFILQFISFDDSFDYTGSLLMTFSPTAAGTFQVFSGTLGDDGWTTNADIAGGQTLALDAPYYSWSLQFGGEQGYTQSAGNSVEVNQISLEIVPEPASVTLLAIGLGFFAVVIHRRRRLSGI